MTRQETIKKLQTVVDALVVPLQEKPEVRAALDELAHAHPDDVANLVMTSLRYALAVDRRKHEPDSARPEWHVPVRVSSLTSGRNNETIFWQWEPMENTTPDFYSVLVERKPIGKTVPLSELEWDRFALIEVWPTPLFALPHPKPGEDVFHYRLKVRPMRRRNVGDPHVGSWSAWCIIEGRATR